MPQNVLPESSASAIRLSIKSFTTLDFRLFMGGGGMSHQVAQVDFVLKPANMTHSYQSCFTRTWSNNNQDGTIQPDSFYNARSGEDTGVIGPNSSMQSQSIDANSDAD